MPQNPYALNGLQSALGVPVPGSQLADPSELAALGPEGAEYLRKSRLRDELKTRLFNEQRAPVYDPGTPNRLDPTQYPSIATQQANKAGEVSALEGLIGSLGEDVGEPGTAPSTALGRQRQTLAANQAANEAAMRAGFGTTSPTPSALQGQYGRSLELTKALSPLSVAQTAQAGETERERMKGAAEIALEQERQKALPQQVELYKQMYRSADEAGMPLADISIGKGGIHYKPTAPTAVPGKMGSDFNAELKRVTDLLTQPDAMDMAFEKAAQTGVGRLVGMKTIQQKIDQHLANMDTMRPGWRRTLPAGDIVRKYLSGQSDAQQPASTTAAPATPAGGGDQQLRTQAIKILQDAGENVTEGNIAHVIGLLQKQQ